MIPPLLTGAIKGLAVAAGTVFATHRASKELYISAFALHNLSSKLLFATRDRVGIDSASPKIKDTTFQLVKHGAKFVAIAFLAKKILGPELKPLGLRAWGVGSNGLKASRLPGVFKWTVEKIPSPIKNAPILGRVFN